MLQRDYMMRQIQQAIELLQVALGLVDWRNYSEALKLIDDGFQRFFGFDSNFINAVPLSYLISMLTRQGVLDADGCLLMAALLKAEGEVYEAQEYSEGSYPRYLRALNLMLEVFESPQRRNAPESWENIDGMVEKLAGYDLPTKTQNRLFDYYHSVGEYVSAEDLLWEWLEASDYASETVEHGISFYQQLLTKSDAALTAGDLPRKEVQAGLAELNAHRE